MTELLHGGDLERASRYFDWPVDQWLDLSTGINPQPYPVSDIPLSAFQNMPYQTTAFREAVRQYYGSTGFVPLNGSQQLIAQLPACLPGLPICLPDCGYQEHARHWHLSGNPVYEYPTNDVHVAAAEIDRHLACGEAMHVLVIHPNNPTGLQFSADYLRRLAGQLRPGACLIVDEAFIDATPNQSLLTEHLPENVLVLRSFGKFFGLAGVRLGFAFAGEHLLERICCVAGLWDINGPAQAVAIRALTDKHWQQCTRQQLQDWMDREQAIWAPLFEAHQPIWHQHMPLFSTYCLDVTTVNHLYEQFGRRGILLRRITRADGTALLRIGRVGSSLDRQRVTQTLAEVLAENESNKYE